MTGRRRYLIVLGGAAAALAMAVAVLGGAVGAGRAATTQQVTASLACEPATVKLGGSTGCLLTVTNIGGNNVNNVNVTVTASAGAYLSSSEPSTCTISSSELVLTCAVGKLTAVGTPGAKFTEIHELEVPTAGSTISQKVEGRYSSTSGNNRGSASISVPQLNHPLITTLSGSDTFDGTFADGAEDSVQTGPISGTKRYTTGATLGTTGFFVGLTVGEQSAGLNNPNCPSTGCFAGQVIDFHITPLPGSAFPDSFELTIQVYVGPGVQEDDIEVLTTGNSCMCSRPLIRSATA